MNVCINISRLKFSLSGEISENFHSLILILGYMVSLHTVVFNSRDRQGKLWLTQILHF